MKPLALFLEVVLYLALLATPTQAPDVTFTVGAMDPTGQVEVEAWDCRALRITQGDVVLFEWGME